MKVVYVLQSIPHPAQSYVGLADSLIERLARHNAGQSPHTSKYRPWRAIASVLRWRSVSSAVSSPALFARAMSRLVDAGRLSPENGRVTPAGHVPRLPDDCEEALAGVESRIRSAGFAPLRFEELAGRATPAMTRLLRHAVDALLGWGRIVELEEGILLHATRLEEARRLVADAIRRGGPITMSRLKGVLGTTRKFAIPIMALLDGSGFTRRSGDVRALAKPS